jgi:hypothetical protein
MKLKKNVQLTGLKPVMRNVLIIADHIWERYGQELVITSGLDGSHSSSSLHYYGYALDLRTRYFNDEEKESVYKELKNALKAINHNYRVIMSTTHIHTEYRGTLNNGKFNFHINQ